VFSGIWRGLLPVSIEKKTPKQDNTEKLLKRKREALNFPF
jgi:hypothetical protein